MSGDGYYHPSQDQLEIAGAVEGALAELLPIARLHPSAEESADVWSGLGALGVFAICLPEDVGALVEKLGADSATLSLVNLNPVEARSVIVQGGAYGEHQFESATVEGGSATPVAGPLLTVRLQPGAGARIRFAMKRYAHAPTLAFPWNRSWYGRD